MKKTKYQNLEFEIELNCFEGGKIFKNITEITKLQLKSVGVAVFNCYTETGKHRRSNRQNQNNAPDIHQLTHFN